MSTQQAAIKAAMAVAKDVAEGRLQPDQLDALAADECRELFGTVVGAGDALWELQVDVARQVLALGGVPGDELAEWLAVTRAAEDDRDEAAAPVAGASWIERALAQLAAGGDDGGQGDADM